MRVIVLLIYSIMIGYFTGIERIGDNQILNNLMTQVFYLIPAYLIFAISCISRNPYKLIRVKNIIFQDLQNLLIAITIIITSYVLVDNLIYMVATRSEPVIFQNIFFYLQYIVLITTMYGIIISFCYTVFNISGNKILAICISIIASYMLFLLNNSFPINIFIFNFIDTYTEFIKYYDPINYLIQVVIELIAIYLLFHFNTYLLSRSDFL